MASVRRLTAILAADVAGYSRLMGADEEGTHERLQAHLRELVNPKVSEPQGPDRKEHRRRPARGICQRDASMQLRWALAVRDFALTAALVNLLGDEGDAAGLPPGPLIGWYTSRHRRNLRVSSSLLGGRRK